ncbi:hypothetical protein [Nocardioides speluncae]|uniref:hypothetical protein n=1 Tax=Nocardioides speluncae TaxID=2670337 RepID=UPI000D68BAED|nr:hypothetical protein [Nocardioides speluncae]
MTVPTRDELRAWAGNLRPDEPLDVGDPTETRYVPLAEAGHSEVDELQATIELAYTATTQLLTGPSGSGKTTELYRLRRDLDRRGYQATMVPITDYISSSAPLDITEFLIALAVGAHDVLGPEDSDQPGFVRRLTNLLQRLSIDLEFSGVTAKASADGLELGALGATAAINLGDEIRTSRPFVEELRHKLANHIKVLYDEVATFLTELLPADHGEGAVLIIDGLEKLRGTTDDDIEVQRSVEALFVNHSDKLRFVSHHLVYTVPTYLQFISPGALSFDNRQFVPVPHVTPRIGGEDSQAGRNLAELREVVARRIPVDDIFKEPSDLDQLLLSSGGHLRDIFRILQRLMNLVLRLRLELPLGKEHVEEAIALVARDFATMTQEQAAFLSAVAASDGAIQPHDDDVQLMARLLQSHMLLAHRNGENWYEVHPLARRALGRT